MKIIDEEKINYDLYLLESTNEHEERLADASLHIIISYCIENRCQISKLRGIIARYLMRHDLNVNENNPGAVVCKKYYSLTDEEILHRIISIIDILDSGYYVYLLKDSITKIPFYAGVGIGSSICDYELHDRNNNYHVNRQLKNKILALYENDKEVIYEVVNTYLNEDEASMVQQLLIKECGLKQNHSLIRSSLAKISNYFQNMCMRFINIIRSKSSGCIKHPQVQHYYSDIEIKHIVEQVIFDFEDYLLENLVIPTYDSYENRYKMDGGI